MTSVVIEKIERAGYYALSCVFVVSAGVAAGSYYAAKALSNRASRRRIERSRRDRNE